MSKMRRVIIVAGAAVAVVAVPSLAHAAPGGVPSDGHRTSIAASRTMDPGGGGGRLATDSSSLGRTMDPGGGGGRPRCRARHWEAPGRARRGRGHDWTTSLIVRVIGYAQDSADRIRHPRHRGNRL